MGEEIIQLLVRKEISREDLLNAVENNPKLICTLVEGFASPKAAVRYGCAKALIELSERHPDWLYPHWGAFAGVLGGRYRPLTWSSLTIISNLTPVDKDCKFEAIFDLYYSLLTDGYMVTAANVVGNSPNVARAKPHLANKIAERLLSVEGIKVGPHMTEECRRVVAEQVVEALREFFNLLGPRERAKAIDFAKRQVGSSRKSLANKAKEFLSLHG